MEISIITIISKKNLKIREHNSTPLTNRNKLEIGLAS